MVRGMELAFDGGSLELELDYHCHSGPFSTLTTILAFCHKFPALEWLSEGQDFKSLPLSAIRDWPPQGGAWPWESKLWAPQGRQSLNFGSICLAAGGTMSLPLQSDLGCISQAPSQGKKELFLHSQSPWPGELEKEMIISSNMFHGSVLWLRSRQAAKDVWYMSPHMERRTREGGSKSNRLRYSVSNVTITKSWHH